MPVACAKSGLAPRGRWPWPGQREAPPGPLGVLGVRAGGGSWWLVHRALVGEARRLLLAAWNDYYSGSLDLAVARAWEAASRAVLLADPAGATPVSYRLLGQECGDYRGAAVRAALLDSLYVAAGDVWLRLALGEDVVAFERGEALDAIEAAVVVVDAARSCGPPRRVLAPPPPPPEWARHAIRVGTVLVVVDEGVSSTRLPDRLRVAAGRLQPGYATVILAGDEALAYLSLPGPRARAEAGEVEVLADETGLAEMLAHAAGNPQA